MAGVHAWRAVPLLFYALAAACGGSEQAERQAEVARRAAAQRERWRAEARARLVSADPHAAQSDLITLCTAAGPQVDVPAQTRDRCAAAFAARAGEKLDASNVIGARADVRTAQSWSSAPAALQRVATRIAALDEATRKRAIAAAAAEERRARASVAKMRRSTDEIEGTTWYYDPSTPRYTNHNSFHLYFGKKPDSAPWLRFRIQYEADDWLFINSFVVVADGRRFDTPSAKFERDNADGRIWEWYDESPSADDLEMINAVIHSRKAVLRLEGDKYRNDRAITSREKAALQSVLNAFRAVGGS